MTAAVAAAVAAAAAARVPLAAVPTAVSVAPAAFPGHAPAHAHATAEGPGWVAQERQVPPAPGWFWGGAAGLAAAVFAILLALALRLGGAPLLPAEEAALARSPLLDALVQVAGALPVRILAAVATSAAVAAVAATAFLLWRSAAAGLFAAALVGADPALHAIGHLATPLPLVAALALGGLAGFVHAAPSGRWLGAFCLGVAALLEPRLLGWSPALAALALLRGHIYAAPKHLGTALAQAVLAPVLGALLGLLLAQHAGVPLGLPACLRPAALDGLLLGVVPDLGGGRHAVHNPATWFGGLGALLFLGVTALAAVAGRFRIQRLPGRVQLRLPAPLQRGHARSLWLLALTAFVPVPFLWLPLLGIALAAGVRDLAEDARGFGGLVALLLLVFALVYTVRLWGLVTGGADAAEAARLLRVTPWTSVHQC